MNSHNENSPRNVIVAGAGFAGLGAAYMLRKQLGDAVQVTVVSPSPHFYFAPSLIWTPFGRASQPDLFDIEPALNEASIAFVRSPVHQVRVPERRVVVDNGELAYDRLLITTGGQPDTRTIPGLAGQFREASWIVGEDSAMDLRNTVRRLIERPAPIVLGVAEGASYASAAYELAFLIDGELRQRGVRDRVPMTFVTAEPSLGDFGFGQTATAPILRELFSERDIQSRTHAAIAEVRRDDVILASGERLPTGAAVIMPPLTGVSDIWKSAGLTDETGLIPVDARFEHTQFEDIYAAGVASYFERPVPPLHGQRAPHTGYLSLCMGVTAGVNLAAALGHGSPASRTLPQIVDVRVLDGGTDGVFIASRGDSELQHVARRLPGDAAHSLKERIEQYLLSCLRTGTVDSFAAGMTDDLIEAIVLEHSVAEAGRRA